MKRNMNRLAAAAMVAAVLIWAPAAFGQTNEESVIRVAAMGDIMLGTENRLPEDGGQGSFLAVIPYLKDADVVFGNYEGALADRGKNTKVSKSGRSYSFRTPPSYAKYLAEAGFNMISIANNHINDYGPEGKQQTIEVLEQHGIAWSGPPGTVARITVDGVQVAMIAFHTSSHSNWVNDIPAAVELVRKTAETDDIVIVSFHGGKEGSDATHTPRTKEVFLGENRGEVVKFSRAVVDAGADLVVGHGPHVPRAMEIHQDRLIAYSLGNFCTGKGLSVKGVKGYAPLLLVDLAPDGRLVGGEVVSFIQAWGRHPKVDGQNRAAELIHQLGIEDFPKSNAVGVDGALIPPGS